LYEPGPGVAARRYALLAAFSACSDARCDGVRPPVAVFGIAQENCAARAGEQTKSAVLEAQFSVWLERADASRVAKFAV
jgi:hypothetical protein